MDRLLIIEPQDLIFQVELRERASATLRLKNVMHTMPVAFNIEQSSSRNYIINPSYGIVPQLGVAMVEIVLSPQAELPESVPYSKDKFLVKSVVVPGGSQTVSLDWFTAKKKQVFSDHSIRVIFVGGAILRRLVADGCVEGAREVLEFDESLVNSADEDGHTPMHVAVEYGRPELVALLLKFGADIGMQSRSGQTVLHEAVLKDDALILELLLAGGLNINAKNSFGFTALHTAVVSGNMVVVQLLLQSDVDLNATLNDGRTALHVAVEGGNHELLRALLEAGADTEVKSVDGDVPLHKVAAMGDQEALNLLLDYGASRNAINKEGKTPSDLARLGGQQLFLLLEELSLGDKLQHASRKGKLEDVNESLRRRSVVNSKDEHGWTALHRAAFKGHISVVQALLDEGADLNCEDDTGCTPLHCAIEAAQKEMVRLLVKHGAQVNVTSLGHCTALDHAISINNSGIIPMLCELGAIDQKVEKQLQNGVATDDELDEGLCQSEGTTFVGSNQLPNIKFTSTKPTNLFFSFPGPIVAASVF